MLTLILLLLGALIEATSVLLGPNKLRHLSPVEALHYSGDGLYDPLTLTFEVPASPHLSNLERRWYAMADPNAKKGLDKGLNNFQLPITGDSRALYSYLTRNATVEVPENSLQFRIVLYPQDQRAIRVNGEEFFDLNTAEGKAYRRVRPGDNEGSYQWKPVGWARFVVRNDTLANELRFQGAFEVDDQQGLGFPSTIYHMTTKGNLQSGLEEHEIESHLGKRAVDSDYVIWRDFDTRELTKDSPLANLNDYGLNNYTFLEGMSTDHLFRRDNEGNDTTSGFTSGANLYSSIGDSSGCPKKRQVALVGIAADCNYVKDFKTPSDLRQHILDMVNQASHLYESAFNISLGLSDIIIANNGSCPDNGTDDQPWNYKCTPGSNAISDRLSRLTQWRSQRANDNMATWSLMTKCDAGSVVGLSWLGQVCQGSSQDASGTNVISRTNLDYLVVAHEIGHSFGAVHDCTTDTCQQQLDRTSQCCPRAQGQCVGNDNLVFVMNPASTEAIQNFSSCSQGNICGGFPAKSINTTCLQANTGGLHLYSNNTCGNGIVEEGEECDCGGEEGCGPNSCCDPKTCKFRQGAVCDDANDVCCNNCQYSSSNTVCRAAAGPCDFAEYCTGNSTGCPSDQFEKDGTSCSLDNTTATNLQCMSGHCSSRDLQCQTLMGNVTYGGSQLGGTVKACSDDSSCRVSCQSSDYGSNICFSTSNFFLDGTPCRGNGKCSNGRCIGGRSSPFGGSFGGGDDGGGGGFPWRWVVIAVAIFVGLLLFGTIWAIISRYCSGRPVGSMRKPVVPPPGQANAPAMNVPAPGYYDQNFSPVQHNSYYDADVPQRPPQAWYPPHQSEDIYGNVPPYRGH